MPNLTPSSGNCYFGSGVLSIDIWSSGAKTTAFFDLGDVSAFTTDFSAEMATKNTSRTGARGLYASAVKSVKGEVSLTLSEWAARNLAVAVLGKRADLAQSSSTVTSQALASSGAVLGASYRIGYYNVSAFVLKLGATALTLGTDYTFNSETGEVKLLTTGTITAGTTTLVWSGTVPAITSTAGSTGVGRSTIALLQSALIYCSLRFVSATDATGPRYDIFLPKVQIAPGSAIDWLKDDFGDLSFKGELMYDSTQTSGQEYGLITELN